MPLPIYHLWVIKRSSGICLVDAKIREVPSEMKLNGVILGGLISAFLSFAQEVFQENIRAFETDTYKLIFSIEESFLIVVLVGRYMLIGPTQRILTLVREFITLKYPQILDDDFNGDITIYEELEEGIEHISKLKGIQFVKQLRSTQKEFGFLKKMKKIRETFEELKT